MTLGDKIKFAREAKGLKQKQLAESMDVSEPTVSRWEKNVNVPRGRLPEIASVLGRPVEWFQEVDAPQPIENKLKELENKINEISLKNAPVTESTLFLRIVERLISLDEKQLTLFLSILENPNFIKISAMPAPESETAISKVISDNRDKKQ